jgi:hypothetical protein
MARGFESKSVADQQEQASAAPKGPQEPVEAHRRRLELSRADVQCRLGTAQAKDHREILQRALSALDKEIASLS